MVVVAVILALVFIGQKYLGEKEGVQLSGELSEEDREAVLNSLSASTPSPLTAEEKIKVLESLSSKEPNPMSPEEQEAVFNSLISN